MSRMQLPTDATANNLWRPRMMEASTGVAGGVASADGTVNGVALEDTGDELAANWVAVPVFAEGTRKRRPQSGQVKGWPLMRLSRTWAVEQ